MPQEQALSQQIEHYLVHVNRITKKTSLLNEEYANYRLELQELQKEFDNLKANTEQVIAKNRLITNSLESKAVSA